MKKEWDVLNYKKFEVAEDLLVSDNVRVLVRRGGCSWCAYIGIPMSVKNNLRDTALEDIECHGGITWEGSVDSEGIDNDKWFWYGWDYADKGDAATYTYELDYMTPNLSDHKWTKDEVLKEALVVAEQFKKILKNYCDFL